MKLKRTFVIAEAGVNHNGSISMARKLIDCAAESGSDAVKFQSFKAELLASVSAPKAGYQLVTTDEKESQFEMLQKLELKEKAHYKLNEHCKRKGIMFLSSPFDVESLKLLTDRLNLSILKIPSGEITNAPLLLEAARAGKQIILSTGMSTLAEIEDALSILAFGFLDKKSEPTQDALKKSICSERGHKALTKNVVLLHCTTEYPAPFDEINLRAMDTLREAFGLQVGLSDHSPGIAVPIAAAARGAVIIEKHFTLDRKLPGPDHKASLEPKELKEMVSSIRQVEKALGSGCKVLTKSEWKNRLITRKSIIAAIDIKKGETFTKKNLGCKRPGIGISPMEYWNLEGKESKRNYKKGEII